MLKQIAAVMSAVFILAAAAWPAAAEEQQSVELVLPVKSAVLMEQCTGKILYSLDPGEKMPPS